MRVPFRKLRPEAATPMRAYTGDAGYDLIAAESVVLAPGKRAIVGTGIAVAIPDGYATRFGVSLVNAPGLVDSGYRGELKVPLINHDREEAFEVKVGMRIAQLVFVRAAEAEFFAVELLEKGADGREEGGFGSSGS